jgi:putative transposase
MQTRKPNRLPLKEYRGLKAYLVTIATSNREVRFEDPRLVEACRTRLASSADTLGFDVYAYCFMPDHLHLLAASQTEEGDLITFVKDFKQRTSYWFLHDYPRGSLKASPRGSLWQRSYHDHILRSYEALNDAAEYVVFNPVTAGIVADYRDYPFSGSLVWPDLIETFDSKVESPTPSQSLLPFPYARYN